MSLPRQVLPGTTLLLTRRCTQREFLLRPSSTTNNILGYVMAYAADIFKIEVHAFAFMSNHVHIVATDRDGRSPQFMHWFGEFSAKCINRLHARKEAVWAPGSYNAVSLEGPEAVLAAIAYTIVNPVNAGLVNTIRKWPGLVSLPTMIGGKSLEFTRPTIFFRKNSKLPRRQSMGVVRPPAFDNYTDAEFVELLAERVRQHEIQIHTLFKQENRRFLGRKRILTQSPFIRAVSDEPRRRAVPRLSCKSAHARIELLHRLKAFLQQYRRALIRYRLNEHDVCFPIGTYMMHVQFGVRIFQPG
jgi:putative transposase